MKRILILGCCGSGKSTLARSLSEITGIDIIHLDKEYWNPNWVETPKEEWNEKVRRLVKKDSWIMDGNYTGSLHLRIPRADTIIILDHGTLSCLKRVIARTWKYYGQTRPDMVKGCNERFDLDFLHYVAIFNIVTKKKVFQKIDTLKENQNIITIKSDKETKIFIDRIRSSF